MTVYTNDYFEDFKSRYVSFLVHHYERAANKARDKEFIKHQYSFDHEFRKVMPMDEKSEKIMANFQFYYNLGQDVNTIIENILQSLVRIETEQQDSIKERLSSRKVKYYRLFWLIPVLLKEITYFNRDGSINSQTRYKYHFTIKNLKLYLKAGPAEKLQFYMEHIIETIEVVKEQSSQPIFTHVFGDLTARGVLKTAVKYFGQAEFWEYLHSINAAEGAPAVQMLPSVPREQEALTGNNTEDDQTEYEPSGIKQYTQRRQVYFISFLFKHLGLDPSRVNNADLARIVHLATAKEIPLDRFGKPKLDNSTIYKAVKAAYKAEGKRYIEDLAFVKQLAEPLAREFEWFQQLTEDLQRNIDNTKE